MIQWVFCLEEASARELIQGLLVRLGAEPQNIKFIVFEGKQDLRRQLGKRLRGWINTSTRFIVLQDQDSHLDCKELKRELSQLCKDAGRHDTIIRLACRELEAFYLGDLSAVESALNKPGLARKQSSRKFRTPDSLGSPSRELDLLTGGLYQKVSGSRAIAAHLNLNMNHSRSFLVLLETLRLVVSTQQNTTAE
jgi:hypothetical protein